MKKTELQTTNILMVECNRRIARCSAEAIQKHKHEDLVQVVSEFSYELQVGPQLPKRADMLYVEVVGQTLLEEGICRIIKVLS